MLRALFYLQTKIFWKFHQNNPDKLIIIFDFLSSTYVFLIINLRFKFFQTFLKKLINFLLIFANVIINLQLLPIIINKIFIKNY